MKTQEFTLTYPWDNNGYKPDVNFQLSVQEDAFHLHIQAHESNPKRVETKHLNYVHLDSCVEWFANFAPELTPKYFNFEFNANGVVHAAFGKDRFERTLLDLEDVQAMNICSNIATDSWFIEFDVPFSLLQKYIPGFEYQEGLVIRSNFHKCGDETEYPHFGLWNPIDVPEPDFHRPEFFGEITV